MNKITIVAKSFNITWENEVEVYQDPCQARDRFVSLVHEFFINSDNSGLERLRITGDNGSDMEFEGDEVDQAPDFIRLNMTYITSIWFDDGKVFGDVSIYQSTFADKAVFMTPAQIERANGNTWLK
jgi:hypothetical protein